MSQPYPSPVSAGLSWPSPESADASNDPTYKYPSAHPSPPPPMVTPWMTPSTYSVPPSTGDDYFPTRPEMASVQDTRMALYNPPDAPFAHTQSLPPPIVPTMLGGRLHSVLPHPRSIPNSPTPFLSTIPEGISAPPLRQKSYSTTHANAPITPSTPGFGGRSNNVAALQSETYSAFAARTSSESNAYTHTPGNIYYQVPPRPPGLLDPISPMRSPDTVYSDYSSRSRTPRHSSSPGDNFSSRVAAPMPLSIPLGPPAVVKSYSTTHLIAESPLTPPVLEIPTPPPAHATSHAPPPQASQSLPVGPSDSLRSKAAYLSHSSYQLELKRWPNSHAYDPLASPIRSEPVAVPVSSSELANMAGMVGHALITSTVSGSSPPHSFGSPVSQSRGLSPGRLYPQRIMNLPNSPHRSAGDLPAGPSRRPTTGSYYPHSQSGLEHSTQLQPHNYVAIARDSLAVLKDIDTVKLRRYADLVGGLGLSDSHSGLNHAALAIEEKLELGRLGALDGLASRLYDRFCQTGNLADLDEAVECYRAAYSASRLSQPALHLLKRRMVQNDILLGNILVIRCLWTHRISELDMALDLLRRAVHVWEGDSHHPLRISALDNLARGLCLRAYHARGTLVPPKTSFTRSKPEEDLEEARLAFQEGLELCGAQADMVHITLVVGMGSYYRYEFYDTGKYTSLHRSITLLRGFIAAHSHELQLPNIRYSTSHILLTGSLGASLNLLFHQSCEKDDLREARQLLSDTIDYLPPNHPSRPAFLAHLGNSLSCRFDQSDDEESLDKAIAYLKEAKRLCSPADPVMPMLLCYLADSLTKSARNSGDEHKATEAIDVLTAASSICRSSSHPHYNGIQGHIGQAHGTRFILAHRPDDFTKSVDAFHACLQSGHDHRYETPAFYGSYGNLLLYQCKVSGTAETHLKESITALTQAVKISESLRYTQDRRQLKFFRDLGDALDYRYCCFGRPEDQTESKQALHNYLRLHSLLAQRSGPSAEKLTRTMSMRIPSPSFSDTARHADLLDRVDALLNGDSSATRKRNLLIETYQKTLTTLQAGTPLWSKTLTALAHTLQMRYVLYGIEDDIKDAIRHYQEALDSRSDSLDTDYNRLLTVHHMSQALAIRAQTSKQRQYADQNFRLLRDTLSSVNANPWGTLHASLLADLGRVMKSMVDAGYIGETTSGPNERRVLERETLERAVKAHRSSLEKIPTASPLRHRILGDLADTLQSLARYAPMRGYNDEALRIYGEAMHRVRRGPISHGLTITTNFARALLNTASDGQLRDPDSLSLLNALEANIEKGHAPTTHLLDTACVRAALLRRLLPIRIREKTDGDSTAELENDVTMAYRRALELLELHVAVCPTVEMQHVSLNGRSDFVLSAASFALSLRQATSAVEILEQGRGLLFSEMRGFRVSLDLLQEKEAKLAERFLSVSRELEQLTMKTAFQYAHGGSAVDVEDGWMRSELNEVLDKKLRLQLQFDTVTSKIREVPGMGNFLRALPFDDLRGVAAEGPVILLNHDSHLCNAIIIHADHEWPRVVDLPPSFFDDVLHLHEQLGKARQNLRSSPKQYNAVLKSVLKALWDWVVGPVCDALEDLKVPKKSRIWWCPTSVLARLPLHAAGPVQSGKMVYLPDLYVSSYTPTLTALIDARSRAPASGSWRKLVVGQIDEEALPAAAAEINTVMQLLQAPTDAIILSGEEATHDNVIQTLGSCQWVHLACHGHLRTRNPFRSFFEVAKGEPLTFLDLVQAKLPNAQFAFLSACHSAEQSPESATEEVLHLAAAMQFSGFRSVVGTMWAMNDDDGPELSGHFYKFMMRQQVPDEERFKCAASALRSATLRMRNSGVGLERWVNYVHIGA